MNQRDKKCIIGKSPSILVSTIWRHAEDAQEARSSRIHMTFQLKFIVWVKLAKNVDILMRLTNILFPISFYQAIKT